MPLGHSAGLSTSNTCPSVISILYGTLGRWSRCRDRISRSSLSWTTSIWRRPRKPHLNPNPSAATFRHEHQRRVVELELLKSLAQCLVVAVLGRIKPTEDHRLDLSVSRERMLSRGACVCYCIAHLAVLYVSHTGSDEPNLTRDQTVDTLHRWSEHAHLCDLELPARCHHAYPHSPVDGTIDHPDVGDRPTAYVKVRIKDQCLGWKTRIARRRRNR